MVSKDLACYKNEFQHLAHFQLLQKYPFLSYGSFHKAHQPESLSWRLVWMLWVILKKYHHCCFLHGYQRLIEWSLSLLFVSYPTADQVLPDYHWRSLLGLIHFRLMLNKTFPYESLTYLFCLPIAYVQMVQAFQWSHTK